MTAEPTRGARDGRPTQGWTGRPVVAFVVRAVLFAAPVVLGWLAVRVTKNAYWQPAGWVGTAAWVVQAVIVAGVASMLASRVANRFAPLTALMKMTLVFPDHAPSRFSMALRSGTVKKLKAGETLSQTSVQEAAEQAVAMVGELGRHERLTRGHTERVRAYAELIGEEMGLSNEDLNLLRWGVLLHDIGKLTVPAEILNKEGKLTEEEWHLLKGHPEAGGRMIAPLVPWLGQWAAAASQHHERWDGAGYPAGLSGTGITLAGRITAAADAYDVITSSRSYKSAMSVEAARQELVNCSGRQFDPAVVRAMLRVGLREPKRIGLFSWLLEVPSVIRVASNAATIPVTAATAVVSATIAVGGVVAVPDPGPVPPALAVVEVAQTTTTTTTTIVPEPVAPLTPEKATSVPAANISSTTTAAAPSTTAAPTATTSVAPTTTTTTAAPTSTTAAVAATTTTTTAAPTTTTVAPTTTTVAPTTTTTTTTTTVAPAPTPTGTGFILLSAGGLPSDLYGRTLTSQTHVHLFKEADSVTLDNPLTVKSFTNGAQHTGTHPDTTVLAAGTVVCSWFIHADTGTSVVDMVADIAFDRTILGLALRPEDHTAADQFAIAGLTYDYQPTGSPDTFTVTGTRIVLEINSTPNDRDHIRVFTAC